MGPTPTSRPVPRLLAAAPDQAQVDQILLGMDRGAARSRAGSCARRRWRSHDRAALGFDQAGPGAVLIRVAARMGSRRRVDAAAGLARDSRAA